MVNFLFWLFTLATALLIPGCMLYFGRRFQKKPPEKINARHGAGFEAEIRGLGVKKHPIYRWEGC